MNQDISKTPLDRMLPEVDVCEAVSVGRSQLRRMIQQNGFPKPVKIGLRRIAFLESDPKQAKASGLAPEALNSEPSEGYRMERNHFDSHALNCQDRAEGGDDVAVDEAIAASWRSITHASTDAVDRSWTLPRKELGLSNVKLDPQSLSAFEATIRAQGDAQSRLRAIEEARWRVRPLLTPSEYKFYSCVVDLAAMQVSDSGVFDCRCVTESMALIARMTGLKSEKNVHTLVASMEAKGVLAVVRYHQNFKKRALLTPVVLPEDRAGLSGERVRSESAAHDDSVRQAGRDKKRRHRANVADDTLIFGGTDDTLIFGGTDLQAEDGLHQGVPYHSLVSNTGNSQFVRSLNCPSKKLGLLLTNKHTNEKSVAGGTLRTDAVQSETGCVDKNADTSKTARRGAIRNAPAPDSLAALAIEAAGSALDPRRLMRGDFDDVSVLQDHVDSGADITRDVLPAIRAGARANEQKHGPGKVLSWTYFYERIKSRKDRRASLVMPPPRRAELRAETPGLIAIAFANNPEEQDRRYEQRRKTDQHFRRMAGILVDHRTEWLAAEIKREPN
jgi:predicted DNA-binding transcriptional regulator AlpA